MNTASTSFKQSRFGASALPRTGFTAGATLRERSMAKLNIQGFIVLCDDDDLQKISSMKWSITHGDGWAEGR